MPAEFEPGFGPLLIWDGACGLCAWWESLFRRLARRPVRTATSQSLAERLPGALGERARREVLWVDAAGNLSGGNQAVVAALRAAGHPIGAWLLGNRAVEPLARRAYEWVSLRRAKIGRWLGLDACRQ
jgi:predicted DCC family thiol-disulfide oxidoreductase YuxK